MAIDLGKIKRETMRATILACAFAVALSACDDSHQTVAAPASEAAQAQAAPASDVAAPAAAPEPAPQPTHNYAVAQDGEYGYQPGISEEDAKNGVATKALAMVRYRGQQNDTYTVDVVDDSGAVFRMQCKDPCDYVKTRVIAGGQVIKTETVANAPESLMHAVFEDVMSGQLQPYVKAKASSE